jgi:23S rRNA (pseudouridine1915-N3)-methyltransferase
MKITLLLHGKTDVPFFKAALEFYYKRIVHYVSFNIVEIPSPKIPASAPPDILKEKEADLSERIIKPGDFVILLDEQGKEFSSVKFATFIQTKMNAGLKDLVFIVGGPYGFHERMYQRANDKVSLSPMTFPHQLVRVIFAEQLYRACTILKNEQYHHG